MHHDEANPLDAVSTWYRKETYLRAYGNFLQPITNMEMWPEISNPKVEPSLVRKMPGRPSKKRKKELGEVSSCGKLSKKGKIMRCSVCKSTNHNIRTCPNKHPATSKGVATSQASTSGKKSKAHIEKNATSKGGKGSPKQQSHSSQSSQAVQQSQSSQPSQAIVESGCGSGSTKGESNTFKRPRVVVHGVFVSKGGFTCAEDDLLVG
ncbi:uncharacterized protein LOC132029780 isoform X2 [Lycium ferocissimum]|uniref:uncharacterized protein LOC132029780 isoform X2 n=1 Tax=Lycium ferocissimum TaxID=112874 RepID=UPI002815A3B3|nr:uncharacterized protein LOC132029780 isoform X2 [Lycium ferocissimum]